MPYLSRGLNVGEGVSCVKVLRFQEDGIVTPDSVAVYDGTIDRAEKMYSITLCARFQIFYLHTRAVFFQLQDTHLKLENMLLGGKSAVYFNKES